MGEIHKTDTSKSPLLQPVIQRDYTKGLGSIQSQPAAQPGPAQEPGPDNPEPGATDTKNQQQQQQKNNFDPPIEDSTKGFSFDEPTNTSSDLQDENDAAGLQMPAGSAKAFANFVGNAIQLYLPKATYGYCKIDMENVIMNVEKGTLTLNWVEVFEKMNKNTETALQIPDESIKMWKSAFKDWLEYKNITAANPETAFIAATILLLADQGVRAYQIKKDNEKYIREALEASNPGMFAKDKTTQPKQNDKTDIKPDQHDRAA